MKVIVAGSRTIQDYSLVESVIKESKFDITVLVSGAAKGVDTLGEQFAKENHIKIKRFPADWSLHGKRAGYLRNIQMAEYADACILIIENQSKGSVMMKSISIEKGLQLFVKEM